jgi:hypothetical protein
VLKTAGVFVVTLEDSRTRYFRPSHIVHGAAPVFPDLALPAVQSTLFTPVDSKLLTDDAVVIEPHIVEDKKQLGKRQRSNSASDAECDEARSYQRSQRKRSKQVAGSLSSSSSSSAIAQSQADQAVEDVVEADVEPHPDGAVPADEVKEKGPEWEEVLSQVDLDIIMPKPDDSFQQQLENLLVIDKKFTQLLIAARQIIVLSDQEITESGIVSRYAKDLRYQVVFGRSACMVDC